MTSPISSDKPLTSTAQSYAKREDRAASAEQGRQTSTSSAPNPPTQDVQAEVRTNYAAEAAGRESARLDADGAKQTLDALREGLFGQPGKSVSAHGMLAGADVEALLAAPA
jgi:hypothetical protein